LTMTNRKNKVQSVELRTLRALVDRVTLDREIIYEIAYDVYESASDADLRKVEKNLMSIQSAALAGVVADKKKKSDRRKRRAVDRSHRAQ
jgi:hypothetical protein